MNIVRAALIVLGAGALTVWLVASGTAPGRQVLPRTAASPSSQVTGGERSDLAVDSLRLRQALAGMPAPVTPHRNPFRFGDEDRAATPGRQPAIEPALPPAEEVRPDRPPMQLLGIAEDEDVSGTIGRTAVITSLKQLHLVREGEQIALRFLVTRIAPDAVELKDLTDDSVVRLTLR